MSSFIGYSNVLDSGISGVTSRVTNVENSIITNKTEYDNKVSEIETKNSTQDNRLTTMEGKLDDIETNITVIVSNEMTTQIAQQVFDRIKDDLADTNTALSNEINTKVTATVQYELDQDQNDTINSKVDQTVYETKIAELEAKHPGYDLLNGTWENRFIALEEFVNLANVGLPMEYNNVVYGYTSNLQQLTDTTNYPIFTIDDKLNVGTSDWKFIIKLTEYGYNVFYGDIRITIGSEIYTLVKDDFDSTTLEGEIIIPNSRSGTSWTKGFPFTVVYRNTGFESVYTLTVSEAVFELIGAAAGAPNVSYNGPYNFLKDATITDIVPTINQGPVITWSITPALPMGLVLDPFTGVISGTPLVYSNETTYVVSASNSMGTSTTTFIMTITDTTLTVSKGLWYNNVDILYFASTTPASATDSQNNIYILGTTSHKINNIFSSVLNSTTNTGGSSFILKLNPDCQLVSGKWLGTNAGTDQINTIVIDSQDNIYISGLINCTATDTFIDSSVGAVYTAGGFTNLNNAYVMKLNTSLVPQWVKVPVNVGIPRSRIIDMVVDSNLNVCLMIDNAWLKTDFITEFSSLIASDGGNKRNMVVFKLNTSGVPLWARWFPSGNNLFSGAIDVDSSGNVYVTGSVSTSLTGEIAAVITDIYNTSTGFIVKLNSNTGAPMWGKLINSSGSSDSVSRIRIDSENNLYVHGVVNGALTDRNLCDLLGDRPDNLTSNNSPYLIKYTSSGVPIWGEWIDLKNFSDGAGKIQIDRNNNIYLTAFSALTEETQEIFNVLGFVNTRYQYILKLSKNGIPLWGKWLIASGVSIGNINFDASNNMIVSGLTNSSFSNSDINSKLGAAPSGGPFGRPQFIIKFTSVVRSSLVPNIAMPYTKLVNIPVLGEQFTIVPVSTEGNEASWSVSPTLPSGVNINTNTGVISGALINNQTDTTYNITATNSSGSSSAKFILSGSDSVFTKLNVYEYTIPSSTTIHGMIKDSDYNCYFIGSHNSGTPFGSSLLSAKIGTTSDLFVLKTNEYGKIIWAKYIIESSFGTIKMDSTGNIYITFNTTKSSLYTDINTLLGAKANTTSGAGIIELSPSGVATWGTWIDSSGTNNITDITIDTNDNLIVYGNATVSTGFTDTNLQAAIGTKVGTGTESFVIKYSPTNTLVWAKWIGGNNSNNVSYSIQNDNQNNIYILGKVGPIYITKLNSLGESLWTNNISVSTTNGNTFQDPFNIAVDSNSNVYVNFRAYGGNNATVFTFVQTVLRPIFGSNTASICGIIKYDSSGNVVKGFPFKNGPGLIRVDGNDNIYLCVGQYTQYSSDLAMVGDDLNMILGTKETSNNYTYIVKFNSNFNLTYGRYYYNQNNVRDFYVDNLGSNIGVIYGSRLINLKKDTNVIYEGTGVYSFTKNIRIDPIKPNATFYNINFSVSPALPAGLSINSTTGVISGIPTTVSAPADYIVTVSNGGTYSTSTTIRISVVHPNVYDSVYWFDATSSDLSSDITIDSNNNKYMKGYSTGNLTLNINRSGDTFTTTNKPNTANIGSFIAKYNSNDEFQWIQWIDGTGADYIVDSSVDSSGNIYVVGYANANLVITSSSGGNTTTANKPSGTTNGAFLIKYNASGVYQWIQWIDGANNDVGTSIVFDSTDNIYVGGYTDRNIIITRNSGGNLTTTNKPSGSTSEAGYVVKYDNGGNYLYHLWLDNTTTADRVLSLTKDSQNNIYVAGFANGTLTISTDSSGNTTTSVRPSSTTAVATAYLVKYNSSGTYQWIRWIDGGSNANNVYVDSDDSIYITGFSTGNLVLTIDSNLNTTTTTNKPGSSNGVFLIKYNNDGIYQWIQWMDGAGSESGIRISSDSDNNIYVIGNTNNNLYITTGSLTSNWIFTSNKPSPSSNNGIFVVRYNKYGHYQFTHWIDGLGADYITGIAIDSSDNIYVSGYADANLRITTDYLGSVDYTLNKPSTSNAAFFIKYKKTTFENLSYSNAYEVYGNVYKSFKPNFNDGYTYSITSALPQGLSFNNSTGEISGKVLQSLPLTNYTVNVSNGNTSVNKSFNLRAYDKLIVAGGNGTNTLAFSKDNGLTFTGLGTAIFSTQCYGISYNGNVWVATGSGTNGIAYSYDGFNWTGLGTSIMSNGKKIVYNGTMFLAGASRTTNNLAYSYDGINWTGLGATLPLSLEYADIAWNGSMWIAVGEGASHSIAYSYDGITWTGIGKSIFSVMGFGVSWNGTRWVAVGQGTNSIAYSNDGINWTGLGTSIFSTWGYSISWNGIRFVACGSGTNTIAYSDNGINWTGRGTTIFTTAGRGIHWNGSMWIAGGEGTNTIATSNDGIVWTGRGASVFSTRVFGFASSIANNLDVYIL